MNFKRWFFILCALLFAASFSARQLHAQTQTTGDLTGTITDPSGAVIPDAKVALRDNSKGARSDTVTNKDGVYHFYLLQPGTYTVTTSVTGFQTLARVTTVSLGQVTVLNLQVSMSQGTQSVTVTEQAPLIQTSNGNFATTVDQQAVQEVPNPGNDLTYVAQTTAGVVMNTSSGSGNFSSFGISANSNLITLNGMDDNDPFFNVNNSGATDLTLGKNEVEEVSVVTNGYSGEYGGLAGASVNYVTRSGGNDFHGRAIYYWNGRALNANSWFNNDDGAPRSFVNANQWGGDFGGPIKKDRLFFYVNDEGLRLIIPTSAPVIIPSTQFETATIANLTTLGLTNSIPFYNNIFSLYNAAPGASRAVPGNGTDPLGCNAFTGLGEGVPCAMTFRSNVSNSTHEQIFSARVDYNIGANDRAFVRFQTDHGFQASYTDPISPVFDAVSTQPQYQGQFVETHTFGTSAVNQFILAGGWYTALFEPKNLSAALTAFPTTLTYGDSSFSLLGGLDYDWPQGRNVTQYQLSDDYSRTYGRHTLKIGGRFKRDDVSDHDFGLFASGVLEPLTLDAFYNGGVDQNSPSTNNSVYLQNFANTLNQPVAIYTVGGYVQDEWRVRPNLTVTAAFRLDHPSNPVCQSNCFANSVEPFNELDHDPTIPYDQVIKTGLHQALTGLTNLEWQPRMSFAWQPFGTEHNTVLRGGIGIFYDNFPGTIADNFSQNPPLLNGFTVTNDNIAKSETTNLFLDAANSNAAFLTGFANGETEAQIAASVPGFAPPALFTSEKFTNVPQYQKWSLEVQQGLGHSMSLTVGYVGNHGIHETVLNSGLNAYSPASSSSGGSTFAGLPTTIPDSRFGPVTEAQSDAISNYNGLIVSFARRFTGGQVSVNYAWSHALDEDSNGGFTGAAFSATGFGSTNQSIQVPENPANIREFNYGNSDYDVRHYLNMNYVWELPLKRAFFGHGPDALVNGWQVSGTLFARTGLPFTPFDGNTTGELAGTNYGAAGIVATVFATYLGGGVGNCSSPSPGTSCLNTANFTGSPNGFGNISRNSVFGPDYFNTDFSIMKKTKIPHWEKGEFGLGFQFFNVFNHPNFDNPVANVSSGLFGDVQRTVSSPTTIYGSLLGADASPRLIQLKAQITF
jgi:hypothetical protein